MDPAKHDCILDAAVRAFRRLGFRKTSIEDVASEAKVGKGTVYLAVRSKDELFLKAVERELAAWLADHATLAADFSSGGLARLVLAEVESARRRPLVHPALSGRIIDTVAEVDVTALRALARKNLRAALEAGRKAGRYRHDLDPDLGAELLQGLEVAALLAHPAPEPPPPQPSRPTLERLSQAVDLVVRGLLRQGALP